MLTITVANYIRMNGAVHMSNLADLIDGVAEKYELETVLKCLENDGIITMWTSGKIKYNTE
jgi:hypothetical protein